MPARLEAIIQDFEIMEGTVERARLTFHIIRNINFLWISKYKRCLIRMTVLYTRGVLFPLAVFVL